MRATTLGYIKLACLYKLVIVEKQMAVLPLSVVGKTDI